MARSEVRRSTVRGMTLIEILVVLVLIGVVLGIVGGNFIGKGEKAKADPEQTHGFGCFTDPRPCRGRGVV